MCVCVCVCYLRSLKFTLSIQNAPTYFDHTIILRELTLFLAKVII